MEKKAVWGLFNIWSLGELETPNLVIMSLTKSYFILSIARFPLTFRLLHRLGLRSCLEQLLNANHSRDYFSFHVKRCSFHYYEEIHPTQVRRVIWVSSQVWKVLQGATGITMFDRKVLQSVTGITKFDSFTQVG